MKKSKRKNKRAQEIEKAIKIVWDSLDSHLYFTHSGKKVRGETHKFHKKCVQEYAEIIKILSKLY